MQAAIINKFGTPSEAFSVTEINTPEPREKEVRIKILAAGLNRLDHYLREGGVNPNIIFPHILGADAVGIIDKLGKESSKFKVGDRVFPMPGYPLAEEDYSFSTMSAAPSYMIRGVNEWGTYAQYMVVPEDMLVIDDTGLDAVEAATLPMPLVTCVRAVKVLGEVKSGDFVLIHGAASGTGSISVQVAKALGARVAGTIRTAAKEEFVKSLGAEVVINVEQDNFVEKIRNWTGGKGADVIIDNLGGSVFTSSLQALKTQGILVSMGMVMGMKATIDIFPFFFTQQQIRGSLMGDMNDFKWGLDQVKKGKIKPTLDKVFSLDEVVQAHERLEAGESLGTIVLKP